MLYRISLNYVIRLCLLWGDLHAHNFFFFFYSLLTITEFNVNKIKKIIYHCCSCVAYKAQRDNSTVFWYKVSSPFGVCDLMCVAHVFVVVICLLSETDKKSLVIESTFRSLIIYYMFACVLSTMESIYAYRVHFRKRLADWTGFGLSISTF